MKLGNYHDDGDEYPCIVEQYRNIYQALRKDSDELARFNRMSDREQYAYILDMEKVLSPDFYIMSDEELLREKEIYPPLIAFVRSLNIDMIMDTLKLWHGAIGLLGEQPQEVYMKAISISVYVLPKLPYYDYDILDLALDMACGPRLVYECIYYHKERSRLSVDEYDTLMIKAVPKANYFLKIVKNQTSEMIDSIQDLVDVFEYVEERFVTYDMCMKVLMPSKRDKLKGVNISLVRKAYKKVPDCYKTKEFDEIIVASRPWILSEVANQDEKMCEMALIEAAKNSIHVMGSVRDQTHYLCNLSLDVDPANIGDIHVQKLEYCIKALIRGFTYFGLIKTDSPDYEEVCKACYDMYPNDLRMHMKTRSPTFLIYMIKKYKSYFEYIPEDHKDYSLIKDAYTKAY